MENHATEPAEKKTLQTLPAREADESWFDIIQGLTSVAGKKVADLGCGEGIYCRAFSKMGAEEVHGFDNSESILQDAKRDSSKFENVYFHQGNASQLLKDSNSFDIVNMRSLLHHVPNMRSVLSEASRILKPGGMILIQDRVPEDVLQPGSPNHLRGYFFETIPRLVKLECENRFTELDIQSALLALGLHGIKIQKSKEIRNHYSSIEGLNQNLRLRKSRSVLKHLTDNELEKIISHIDLRLKESGSKPPILEVDRWTIWTAVK